MSVIVLILFLITVLSSCQQNQSPAGFNGNNSAPTTPATTVASSGTKNFQIQSVDFRNFTYDWYPQEYKSSRYDKIILEDGSMDVDLAPGKEPRKFFLVETKYGDLTQDGNDEAVVILGVVTSGTARHSLVFVYGMSGEVPIRLFVYESGDRWDYGYHEAAIKDGQLFIEVYKPIIAEYEGKKHDMSASNTYIRHYYKWDGARFNKLKTEEVPADPADKNPWVSLHRMSRSTMTQQVTGRHCLTTAALASFVSH